jgi:hypothetical protein
VKKQRRRNGCYVEEQLNSKEEKQQRQVGVEGSAARSPRQVPLLGELILVVSSKPVQLVQRGFGVRFIYV